jgi:beta-glucosidase
MAQESMVLLQNNGTLPLKKSAKIAVMGPNAADSVMMWGNYNGTPAKTVTLLEAVKAQAGDVIYDRGCDYVLSSVALQSLYNQCRSNGKQGFSAKYWNNSRGEGAHEVTAHYTTPLRFSTAGAIVFAPGVNLTNFAAVYESTFTAQKDGDVAFYFQSQGNTTLFVDGQRVAFVRGSDQSKKAYTLKAKAGKRYDIRINFSSTRGDATLNFDLGYEVPISVETSVAKVKDADIVVFAGGIAPSLEGEEMSVNLEGFRGGDRTAIELPAVQVELVQALKNAGKKVVFVNFSGSAMALTEIAPYCDAIIQAWYPGQAGGTAVASVLYGDYNPAGRLPVTFYKSTDQLPDFEDYSMKGRTYRYMTEAPLFPFGHGLSYTTFNYGDAKLSANSISGKKKVKLTVPVTNNGNLDGEEVVQVYVKRVGDNEGPSHALRGFKRVGINKGATQDVVFELTTESFEWFDTNYNDMRAIEGEYEIYYGGTSDLSKLRKLSITVK